MLVLSRRLGEAILIGDDIRVVVTKIDTRSRRIRLGIEAPKGTTILREELSTKTKDVNDANDQQ